MSRLPSCAWRAARRSSIASTAVAAATKWRIMPCWRSSSHGVNAAAMAAVPSWCFEPAARAAPALASIERGRRYVAWRSERKAYGERGLASRRGGGARDQRKRSGSARNGVSSLGSLWAGEGRASALAREIVSASRPSARMKRQSAWQAARSSAHSSRDK